MGPEWQAFAGPPLRLPRRAPSTELLLIALGLALLSWGPIGWAGLPGHTHDGFQHLAWGAAWIRQLQGGWLWPQWSDLSWAGAGSAVFQFYPPLFRLLGTPLGLLGWAPVATVQASLLLVMLINATGAWALAGDWLPHRGGRWGGAWRLLLVTAVVLNPYFLINLYVRGAWPEALGQALLTWLALGLARLPRRPRSGIVLTAVALGALVLSNWNTALLALVAWGLAMVLLAAGRQWRPLVGWGLGLGLALGATAPFWWPALSQLGLIRPPVPAGLYPEEFFFAPAGDRPTYFADLLWVQGLVILLLLGVRLVGWGTGGWRPNRNAPVAPLASWGLLLALATVVMVLPISAPIYGWITPLQRLQFPWRWLSLGWLGALLWLCSPAALGLPWLARSGWRRGLWVLGALLALVLSVDSLNRFRTNLLTDHLTPAQGERLNTLLRCPPLDPCPAGLAALREGSDEVQPFIALGDGRIAITGMRDYSPAGIPDTAWQAREVIFWQPRWPQTAWAHFEGDGRVSLRERRPQRITLTVDAAGAGRLRVMQWAYPAWRVQTRRQGDVLWSPPLTDGGRDPDGWISVPLQSGPWEVALTYGQSR